MKRFLTTLISLHLICLIVCQHESPCPEIFQYEKIDSEPGKWTGTLVLNTEYPLSGTWIRIVLDRKFTDVESTYGEIRKDEKEFLISNRDYNLIPGSPLKFQFTIHYNPEEPIPNFVGVRLNARTICPVGKDDKTKVSKCPGVFSYSKEKEEEGIWHGTLTLDSEFELKGVWIRVTLDRPSELLVNEFGEVKTKDNSQYLVHNRNYTLVPGHPLRFPFSVKYDPKGKVPNIQTVRLNARTVCGQIISEDNNNRVIIEPNLKHYFNERVHYSDEDQSALHPEEFTPTLPSRQQTQTPKNSPLGGNTTTTSTPPSTTIDTTSNSLISCGSVLPESLNLIVKGERAHSAQWPWHGAIYIIRPQNLDYICGMSLISERHALTAAHCVLESITTKKVRDPKTMVLYFGLLNRKDFTSASVQRPIPQTIIVHSDYKVSENDIGVIKFEKPVRFTDFVRPVCLWEGDTDIRYIVNQTGTVVGFGVTETGSISDELLFANILVVDTPTCIFSHRDFYSKYASLTTFCAGNLTQSAVCNGDSGGGMVFKRDGTDVWQIRGIVSTAVRNVDTGLCDYNYYAIFTDLAKYTNWIEKVLAM